MELRSDKSITSPILIGRTADLEALTRLIEQVHAGTGPLRTVLVTGEAGIGKSRLVAEATRLAQRLGFALLQGNCFEYDRALPYAAVLDILRAYSASHTAEAIARDLGPILPELAPLLPRLALDQTSPTPMALTPEQAQRRRFEALAQLFVQLTVPAAGTQHGLSLLLVVEDIHWCDDISLEFILFLARRIVARPIMLMLTYRNDEVHSALQHFLVGLDREHLALELALARLTRGEMDALIRAIFEQRGPVRAEFVETLYGLTAGNPFFIEEILKALLAAGEIFYTTAGWNRKPMSELHIPRTVQDAVQRRTRQLDEPTRRLLTLAAVAGGSHYVGSFDFSLLQHVTGHDESTLLQMIKALIAAQLVVEESADRFAFRHALTRQAVYTQLLVRERRALHRTIAETIERTVDTTLDTHLSDLAYQFYEAGVWDRALDYARRAGEQAQQLYAPRAACEQFTRALDAARQQGLARSGALYRARGQSYETLGEFDAARADYTQALEAARQAQDRTAEWQSLLDLGWLWTGHDYERAGDYLQRALDLAHTMHDPATLADTLNRAGNWYANSERPREARRHHEEALAIFLSMQDRRGEAATLDLLGISNLMGGDMLASARFYERAIRLFREFDDRQALASSLALYALRGANYMMPTMALPNAVAADCLSDGVEAIELAQMIGWRAGEAFALMYHSLCLGPHGEYARALAALKRDMQLAVEVEHLDVLSALHFCLAALYLDLLMPETGREHAEQGLNLAQRIGSAFLLRSATAFLAATCSAQHDYARAETVIDAALGTDVAMETMAQRLVWVVRAELELARSRPAAALDILDRLIETATDVPEGSVIPRLWYLRATALLALDRIEEAETVLQAARVTAEALSMPPLLWRIHLSLGKLYRAGGQRDQAATELATARDIVAALAANLPDAILRDTFTRRASALIPAQPAPTPLKAARLAAGGLTGREREVVGLIAQGKTNREIAAALILSQRTVQVHITNILTKLDFTSRAQIAAWAVARGLATAEV